MNSTRSLLLLFSVTLLVSGGAFFWYLNGTSRSTTPEFATVWPTPRPLPDFELLEHGGEVIGPAYFRGSWSLVFFGFTHCPDICPATLQQLALAQARLGEDSDSVPGIVLVSVDPERDSPDALASYVTHFGDNVAGITGDLEEIRKFTSTAGVFFEKSPLPNDDYTVDHSAVVLLLNEDGAIHASFSAPHRVDNFVSDIAMMTGDD